MSAVTTTTTATIARVAFDRLRTAALAALLACATSGAYASMASVVIKDFSVAIDPSTDPNFFVFAPFDTRNQAWYLEALDSSGLSVVNLGSVPDWSNVNETAPSAPATATVSSSVLTSPLGLETPIFTLAANATPASNSVMPVALGNMLTSGSFCFWDSTVPMPPDFDGTSAFCSGSGSLTFTVFYDLLVELGAGSAGSSAYAEIGVSGSGLQTPFFDFASTVLNTGSKEDQFFSWTVNLASGDAALFDLSGVVVAQAVPEPNVLALAALGLLGLAATRRRRGPARSAA